MTLIDFPKTKEEWSKPKTLEDWPWDQDLGKPYGDINGQRPEIVGEARYAPVSPATENVDDILHGSQWTQEQLNKFKEGRQKGPSPAAIVLAEAVGLLEGDRAKQHGDKVALHRTMAGMFSAYLGCPIKPSEAAMLEALMKAARTKHGLLNKDDFRDGAAYFGIAWECADAGC